jgi:hypothetical protein
MLAFRVIFTGAAIGTLILVAVHQRALRPAAVASLEYKAPALESVRLDGLVKLREQMMQAPRPQPELALDPPLQKVTLGSMPDPAPGASSGLADDLIGTGLVPSVHHDATQPAPTTSDQTGVASNAAPVTQDFQYLIYYVWSEVPPAEKPAETVLHSLKDIPVGTPLEEIKRASHAFGLDFNSGCKDRVRFQP